MGAPSLQLAMQAPKTHDYNQTSIWEKSGVQIHTCACAYCDDTTTRAVDDKAHSHEDCEREGVWRLGCGVEKLVMQDAKTDMEITLVVQQEEVCICVDRLRMSQEWLERRLGNGCLRVIAKVVTTRGGSR